MTIPAAELRNRSNSNHTDALSGTPAETAALDAYIKLMRAAEAVTARVDGVMAAAGLTIGQFGVLEAAPRALVQRDLGAKLFRSDGNITVVVANLVRRGLVEQARRRDDRRRDGPLESRRAGGAGGSLPVTRPR